MTPATSLIAGLTDTRRDALAWLIDQIRWERTLDRLRSDGEGRTERAA